MTIPEDENKPQPPAGGESTGAVPPVPPAAEPAAAPSEPIAAPAEPVAPQAGAVPPPPGAFPAYAAAAPEPVAAPTATPTTVTTAFWLYVASAVLSVIGGIITIATVGNSRAAILQQIQTNGTNLRGESVDTVVNAAIGVAIGFSVVTLIFWAITFVLFAFFMRRGANWARIVLTVLTALSLLNILTAFGVGALQVVLAIVAVVLMWLRPSSAWFAAVRASKAPRA
jgi:hypothetical protein